MLVLVGTAPINFALVLPRTILPMMQHELGGVTGAALLTRMIIAIIGMAIVIGAPIAGLLLKRFGHLLTMSAALTMFVAMGCLPYFLSDLRYIVLSRLFLGVAISAIQVSAVTLVGTLYDSDQRARMIGLMMAVASLSALALGPIAGRIGELGWRPPFLLHLLLAPFIVIAICALPRRARAAAERSADRTRTAHQSDFPFILIGVSLVTGAVLTLPPLYLAYRLRDIGIVSPALIGASYMAINIPEMLCASIYGFLRRSISTTAMCSIGFAFAAAALALMAATSNYHVVLLGMALFGPATAFTYSSLMDRASADKQDRARAVSLVISSIFLSLVLGTVGFEPVFKALGSAGVLMVLAVVSLGMMSALTARLTRRRATRAGRAGIV